MPTTTTNYSFQKPIVGADEDDWGGYLNANWDSVDAILGGGTTMTGLDVNGTIKLDGNYPVGTGNVALGDAALNGSLTGNYNTAVGQVAGTALTSGTKNAFFGSYTADANTTGSSNTALGQAAFSENTTGNYNTAVGNDALFSNTTASFNTAVGYQAAYSTTTPQGVTAIGANALQANTTGGSNTAIGGTNNVSAGGAMEDNTTGANNVAVGTGALQKNTTASNNTAVGYSAGKANTTGTYNTFVGKDAGLTNTTGSNSSYFGEFSGRLATGNSNTFYGQQSGHTVTTGEKNTILGRYNGNQGGLDIRTSDNNIVLSDGDGNPRLYITDSNTVYASGVYSQTSASAANVFVQSNGALLRSTSSLRYKNTVQDATHGLTELLTLRPVTYKGNNDGDTVFGGLIAEEVHDAGLTEFVQYNDDGEPDALAYGNMVSLCIKAIQEQQATIEALEARITALESA